MAALDKRKPIVFLDSCALVSAVMSAKDDSEIRQLLKLGEASVIDLRVCQEVLSDVEWVVRKRRETALPLLAYLIDL